MSIRSLVPGLVSVMAAVSLLAACGTTPIEADANEQEVRKRAQVHLQLAVAYYARGQFETAQEEVRKAIRLEPNNVDTYNVQGLIYMSQGQGRQAEENFQRALRISPDNPEVLNNYGWFLCQNDREREAISYFDRVLQNRVYQNQARVLNNAGICSVRIKDVKSAESYFLRAFEQEPGNPAINTSLADIYYRRNELSRAEFYINRALKAENLPADTLWLAVRIERKLGNDVMAANYANQLRRRYPESPEFAAYLRGAFDE
jgi:type IV pilus assembly protein PilF